MVYAAHLSEILYHLFGIEPIFTRLEVNLMAITNTYSIEKAKNDLGYTPVANHDLTKVVKYYRQTCQTARHRLPSLQLLNGGSVVVALFSFLIFLWFLTQWF